ncbi:MAG: FtsX-like permease family protein [Pirellulales bacterium]|nr:FtsX-like permease family protein [Pirellulales bacterium]
MNVARLVVASLVHHWRTNLAVAAAVAAAVAVLTGALVVGDSMRASLRRLAIARLGRIDHALVVDRFFLAELADELARQPGFDERFSDAVPVVLLRASLSRAGAAGQARRVGRVNVIGCDDRFGPLGPIEEIEGDGPLFAGAKIVTAPGAAEPSGRWVVLNRPLADALGAAVGDVVVLHLARPEEIPADSPLGRKNDTLRSARLTVEAIVPGEGLGGFALRSAQQTPRNAFLDREALAELLGQPGRANAILVAERTEGDSPLFADAKIGTVPGAVERLETMLHPRPTDYGLRIEKTPLGYVNVTSDRLLLEPRSETAIEEALGSRRVRPALAYLANTIARGQREIPYSTVAGVDFDAAAPLGPLRDAAGKPIGPLAKDEVVLNQWAAEQLQAKVGDEIRIAYFEPETTHGTLRERSVALRLAAIAPLTGAAADPALVPSVAGVTDQLTMADWDPPFPFDAGRIRPDDEAYWEEHRATPKAFVSLATGRRLWASRFGRTTSLRVAPKDEADAKTLARIELDPRAMGFVFQPVKQQALEASSGATPFGVLFLAMSFFLVASAVMLVAILFRLGVQSRAAEIGLLLALGFRTGRIARLLLAEGLAVAALGSLVGVLLALGYAGLMVGGLRTWWLAAVGTPFVRLDAAPASLLAGLTLGLAAAATAIAASAWRLGFASPRRLLAGECEPAPVAGQSPRKRRYDRWVGLLLTAAAVGASLTAMASPRYEAGAFFGAAALVLAALVTFVRGWLVRGAAGRAIAPGRGNLLRLAARNAARNPGRSSLSIGLVASACFLIVAMSAFHIDPTDRPPRRASGDGGFALVAESDQPIYQDLNTLEGRRALGFSDEDEAILEGCAVYSFRVRSGDDASCLNLYQARQPRVLGVGERLIARGGFAWAAAADAKNPWTALETGAGREGEGPPVPVVMDKNTANYALHLWRGLGEGYTLPLAAGPGVPMTVAGLLDNSLMQGDLLIAENEFLGLFPDQSGCRFFLIEAPPERAEAARAALERTLGDYGFSAEPSGERLADFLAVQNTYLATFRSLGGLGLLLGTFGLAAVQVRNVLARRRELALLRAVGLGRRAIGGLVAAENAVLLVAGLVCGAVAALVALVPHLLAGGATIPWASLAGTLGLVLLVGLIASLAAVRAAVGAPLVAALREE